MRIEWGKYEYKGREEMAIILIEGDYKWLAEKIRQLMDIPADGIKVVSDAHNEIIVNAHQGAQSHVPKIVLFKLFFHEGIFAKGIFANEELINTCVYHKIPLIALLARPYRHKTRGEQVFLMREALRLRVAEGIGGKVIGTFYDDCHEHPFCLEELVSRIKAAIT